MTERGLTVPWHWFLDGILSAITVVMWFEIRWWTALLPVAYLLGYACWGVEDLSRSGASPEGSAQT